MGKNKNKNKVSGAVKAAAKTEKKLANKLNKELAYLGEEDIAKVIAEREREEAKRSAALEKNLPGPPSARAFATLTPHPLNDELIMFGGEYYDGQKTEVNNDLLFFNPEKGTWKQVNAPSGPPPRSAHQAIATSANKGELWVFGGEFISSTETQFHHYKDLWCFSLADKKWEKVVAPNGPSSRSCHRMMLLGRRLIVFGGYHDDGKECRYFDDLYSFCLDLRTWSKLSPNGKGPSARSACVMLPAGNDSLYIYGGFSRVRSERTRAYTDLFQLSWGSGVWTWRALPVAAHAPPARATQAAAVNLHTNMGYIFGGIGDLVETEQERRGVMTDELHLFDLESCKWQAVTLKSEQAPAQMTESKELQQEFEEKVTTVVKEDDFTLKLGGDGPAANSVAEESGGTAGRGGPSPRMSAMMCVQRSTLYLYGGVLKKMGKKFYLGDLYSLDLDKLSGWQTIYEQPSLPDWMGSDSAEDCESESGTNSDTETDDCD